MSGVDLDVIVTGRMPTPHAYVFRHDNPVRRFAGLLGETIDCPCLAWVIRHPSAGTIVVDTGFHPDTAGDLRKDFGLAMSLLFRRLEPAAEPFDAQLRNLGVDPDAVERAVMTHLHADHTSGMRLLPRARFACTREEWAAATRPRAAVKGYVGHHLPRDERVDLVDFDRDGEPHGPFARTVDWLGDGSVRLVSTPGHTVGHMSLLVRLADGRSVLVAGDAAYTRRSIEEQRLPLFTADDRRSAATLRELGAFTAAEPRAIVVPTHDPDAWRDLGATPSAAASARA